MVDGRGARARRRPAGDRAAPQPLRASALRRLPRPALAAGAACVLALGVAIGWGVDADRLGRRQHRDRAGGPRAGADGAAPAWRSGATARRAACCGSTGMPQPAAGQVYQAWVQRGGRMRAGRRSLRRRRATAPAAPRSRTASTAPTPCCVTREPQGGTRQPTRAPGAHLQAELGTPNAPAIVCVGGRLLPPSEPGDRRCPARTAGGRSAPTA